MEHKCSTCHDGYMQEGEVCSAAPCNVSGSNMLPGLECACLDQNEGKISWSGPVHFGRCSPRCRCDNGRPATGCTEGQTSCISCNNGFHMVVEQCLPQCSCPNGRSDVFGCRFPNQTLCETCNLGYELNHAQCHPTCSCQNGQPDAICDSINETKCSFCNDGFTLDGKVCRPAECDVPYSIKTNTNECECDLLQGMDGTLQWNGDRVDGRCHAVNCSILGATQGVPLAGSGPDCSCAPGFAGTVKLYKEAGQVKALTSCKQVPCMPFAEFLDGTCRCKRGFAGENIMWNLSSWSGQCRRVECSVDRASRDCKCEDGYYSSKQDLWSHEAQNWTGECSAVECNIRFSTRIPGADCKCLPGLHGGINFHGKQASGFCYPGLRPLLREVVSLPAGTLCSFALVLASITMLSRQALKHQVWNPQISLHGSQKVPINFIESI